MGVFLMCPKNCSDPEDIRRYIEEFWLGTERVQPPLTMGHAPPPTFGYPPSFPAQEQPQSMHGGYTLAPYYPSSTPLSPVHDLSFALPVPAGYASPPAPTAALPVHERSLYLYPPNTHVAHSRGGMPSVED
ncbi:hypothetical protein DFH09DRAFT_1317991 [Mycena vulgaris]|nr:hypothetical protein DFH09DRAFT_1317991 [Mycena vulgaris]